MISFVGILHSKAKLYIMLYLWGSSPILSRTLFYASWFDPSCLEARSFLCWYFVCHHEKCEEFVLVIISLLSLGVGFISFRFTCFVLLGWDKSLSLGIFLILFLWLFRVHLLNLCSFMCWFGSSIQFGHLLSSHTFVCVLLVYLVFLFKLYLLLVLESLMHAYLLHVYIMACLLSLIQYVGETPPNPNWLRCAWNSISY